MHAHQIPRLAVDLYSGGRYHNSFRNPCHVLPPSHSERVKVPNRRRALHRSPPHEAGCTWGDHNIRCWTRRILLALGSNGTSKLEYYPPEYYLLPPDRSYLFLQPFLANDHLDPGLQTHDCAVVHGSAKYRCSFVGPPLYTLRG